MAAWEGFLREARRFWQVAEVARDLGHFNQAASNAIHAAIAANDALCLFLGGERPRGQSHAEAARVLRRVCQGTQWEQEAATRAQQLTEVLQEKTAVQYEGRPIGARAADRVMKQAARFLEWAEAVLPPQRLQESP
jgi:HEPN domain-containing protein